MAHTTPSFDAKMLLKVFFDKTEIVKFKISNNLKQNIDETPRKQPKIHRKIHTSHWILKIKKTICEPKVSRLLSNVCNFQKENHTLGYGFKNP